jgi:hypothetical protein
VTIDTDTTSRLLVEQAVAQLLADHPPSSCSPEEFLGARYDAGLAWDSHSRVKLTWSPSPDPENLRTPVRSWGGSIRVNALGFVVLRLDYTKPLSRPHGNPYWTLSLGPTF